MSPTMSPTFIVNEKTGKARKVAVKNKPTFQLDSFGHIVHVGKTPMLGSGSTRNVYAIDAQRVLKIPRSADHSRYNQNEYDCWQAVRWTRYGDLFAPVWGLQPNGWLIMERAQVLEYEKTRKNKETQKELDLVRDMLHKLSLIDLGSQNFGYLPNGRLVVIDYGFSNSGDIEKSLRKQP